MQACFTSLIWLLLILLVDVAKLMNHSPTRSNSSSDFDWKGLLNDFEESSTSSPRKDDHSLAQEPNEIVSPSKRQPSLIKVDQGKGEEDKKLQRIKQRRLHYEDWQNARNAQFNKLSDDKKEKIREERRNSQRRYRKHLKMTLGFSSRQDLKLAEARMHCKNGTATSQHFELLQNERIRQKRKYEKKMMVSNRTNKGMSQQK